MIVSRTFSRTRGVTARTMRNNQVEARAEAEEFINGELKEEDLVAITESALPGVWSNCYFSVTVWYRRT